MRTDEDLRRALHDLAEDWGDTSGLEARIRHRQGRRRRRVVALAAAAAAIVGAVAVPQLLGPDEDDRSLIADEGPPRTADGWRTIADAPIEGRAHPAGAWTGEELLVFGGQSLDGRTSYDDGARYDPSADTWRPIADGPAHGRYTVSAWTGSELLLWGHVAGPLEDAGVPGAAYDPVEDRWRPLPEAPIPSQAFATGVWTGEELVVWGGYDRSDDGFVRGEDRGAAYDPSTNEWRPIAEAPLEGRHHHGAVWTGDEMVVWGGAGGDGAEGRTFADGAAYDPDTDTWRTLPAPTGFAGRMDPTLLWTGRDVLVWGGTGSDAAPRLDWATYSPPPDDWMSGGNVIGADPERFGTSRAVWADDRVVVLAADGPVGGYAFTPDMRTETIPDGPVSARQAPVVVWTGEEVVVWGGEGPDGPVDDGAAWTPAPRRAATATTATSVDTSEDPCVAEGPATAVVPSVVGLSLAGAIEAVTAAGLTVVDDGIPPGDPGSAGAVVTAQAPPAGAVVPEGACIGFRTAPGPAPGTGPHPDLQAAAPGREVTFEGIGDVRLGDVLDPEDVWNIGEGDDCGSWGPIEASHDGDEPLRGEVTGASTAQPRVVRIKVFQNPTYRTPSGVGVGTTLETLQRIYGDRLVVDRADGWESPTDGLLASYTDVAAVREGDAALTYHLRDDVVDGIKLSRADDWGDDEGCA